MGECGCGSTDIMLQFPGPEGVKYGLEVYPSCHYCGTPAGIVLHRFDPSEESGADVGEDFFQFVPEAEFHGYVADYPWALTEMAVPVVAPDDLADEIARSYGEEGEDPPVTARDIAWALPSAVHSSLSLWAQRRREDRR